MVGPQSSSFIPKPSTGGGTKRPGVRRIYIFTYIAFVVFFGTIIAAAGTFFYQVSVESQLEAEKEKLVRQKEAFSQADIEKIKSTALQIDAAKMLLNNHISAASIFETLEDTTVASIQLTNFSLVRSDFTDIVMTVSAQTNGFNPALFQREIIKQNPVLANSNLINATGNNSMDEDDPLSLLEPEEIEVTFAIEKSLMPNEVPYEPYTQRQPAARNVVQDTVATSEEETNVSDETEEEVDTGNQVTQ